MKKHYPLLLAFLVAFTSFFVSCDEDNFEDSNRCKITVTCTEGGKVKISKYLETSEIVLIGSEIEVVATADEGYAFTGWYLGDSTEPVSTDAVFTFVATKNTTLTAHFTKLSNLTICSAGNGRVSFKDIDGTSRIALYGFEVTVVAIPNEGCDFIGWFIGDAETPVSTDAEYTFIVTEKITLTAKFSKRSIVAVRSAGYGSVSIKDVYGTSNAFLPGSEVTVVATPDEDCDFIGWFVDDGETPVSTDAEYTFVVEEDIALTAQFERRKTYIDGYEYVDLGLPSGLKWANINVGASAPEDYGGYYAWGETEEKSNYTCSTYKWCKGSIYTMTKYCTNSNYGTVDNKTTLDPEDDVAHVKWGGTWRMPTQAELDELRNICTWTWTTQNGVNGNKVTGPNGNSIFLPATGGRYGTEANNSGSAGYYLSSSLYSNYSVLACCLYFYSDDYGWSYNNRYSGHSVRPVSK
ncbi:MAG: InlB B-repeat-containing protein [Bacteroidaceae bacterium]|nr:InlB B-repeat-containing protein [Bacteroidaceae bacterium]